MSGRASTPWYQQLKAASPLKLVRDVDDQHMERISLKNEVNGDKRKCETYRHSFQTFETALYCLQDFRQAQMELELENGKLFQFFRKTLRTEVQAEWDLMVGNAPRTTQNFEAKLHEFLTQKMGRGSFEHFMAFFNICGKPMKMPVHEWIGRLKLLALYSSSLCKRDGTKPTPEEVPGPTKLKEIFINSMPEAWRTKWEDSARNVENLEVVPEMEIIQFFKGQEDKEGQLKRKAATQMIGSYPPKKPFERPLVGGRSGSRFQGRFQTGGRGGFGRQQGYGYGYGRSSYGYGGGYQSNPYGANPYNNNGPNNGNNFSGRGTPYWRGRGIYGSRFSGGRNYGNIAAKGNALGRDVAKVKSENYFEQPQGLVELDGVHPTEVYASRIVAMSFCEPRSCIGRLSS